MPVAFERVGPSRTTDRSTVAVRSGLCVSTFMASPSCPAPRGQRSRTMGRTRPSDPIRPVRESSRDAGSAAVEEGEEDRRRPVANFRPAGGRRQWRPRAARETRRSRPAGLVFLPSMIRTGLVSRVPSVRGLLHRSQPCLGRACSGWRAHRWGRCRHGRLAWCRFGVREPFRFTLLGIERLDPPPQRWSRLRRASSPPHLVVATLKPPHLALLSQVLEKEGNFSAAESVTGPPDPCSTASGCGSRVGTCGSATGCG